MNQCCEIPAGPPQPMQGMIVDNESFIIELCPIEHPIFSVAFISPLRWFKPTYVGSVQYWELGNNKLFDSLKSLPAGSWTFDPHNRSHDLYFKSGHSSKKVSLPIIYLRDLETWLILKLYL